MNLIMKERKERNVLLFVESFLVEAIADQPIKLCLKWENIAFDDDDAMNETASDVEEECQR